MRKSVVSEIYLTSKFVSKESWHVMFLKLAKYLGSFSKFEIFVVCEMNKLHYYVETDVVLPTMLGDISDFMFGASSVCWSFSYERGVPYINQSTDSIIDFIDKESLKKSRDVKMLELNFRLARDKLFSHGYLYINEQGKIIRRRLFKTLPEVLLSIDFSKNKKYTYQSPPKYLDFQKALSLLQSDSVQALFSVSTFPYFSKDYYLNLSAYSFDKHSLVVGSTGSGKSKFISLLISRLATTLDYKLKYKIVVIDPHASLEEDIGGIRNSSVIDFETMESSINLFVNSTDNIVVSVELLLSLLSSYMKDLYNSKLERILRHSLLLLLYHNIFSFQNLRKLLLEVEYRESLLLDDLPDSITSFFLTDFNELKNKYYNESIAPILSFLDEMEFISVFQNECNNALSLQETIKQNFLTLFSLNRNRLGESCVKTISGLIMQQLITVIQDRKIDEHIIFIVDEVSVVENPILLKFLSEARKFGLSLILVQQYFEQISGKLQEAIFANVVNYYVFRVSRRDASILASNISMKLSCDDSEENRISMLINLGDRECVVRLGSRGVLLPAFKARTVDFVPVKRIKSTKISKPVPKSEVTITPPKKKFEITPNIKLTELLLEQSSSRRNMRGDTNE